MPKFLLFLILFTSFFASAATDDNVVIASKTVNYRLKASNGKLASVKEEEELKFLALRADEKIIAATYYGNGIKIDRASAPNATPIYRSWENDDYFFTGTRICALPVMLKKDKSTKVVFESTYTQPEQFTEIILVSSLYRMLEAEYNVYVPASIADKVMLTPYDLPEGVEMKCETSGNGDKVYSVKITNVPAYKKEKLGAPAVSSVPRIQVTGYFPDTNSLYTYLHDKVNDNEQSEKVATFARSLCDGLDDDIAKIDTIATWVRDNIRYVAIEHGEYGIQPDLAEAVFDKRFGDCKGSANLIRVMLNSVGIDGRLVWIGTRGDVMGSWKNNPTLAAGNHMIAAAVLPDTIIYIDGTISRAPKGFVPSSISGQECLIQNGVSYSLGKVPEETSDVGSIILNADLTIDAKGLTGRYKADYVGQERFIIENYLAGLSVPKRKALLEKIITYGRKGIIPDSITVATSAVNAPLTTVSYRESDPSGIRTLASGKTYLIMRPFRTVQYPRLEEKDRLFPIELGNKCTYETHFKCEIPDDYTLESLPERVTISSLWFEGYVEYSLDNDGKTVVCDAMLRCVRTDGLTSEVTLWNETIKAIDKASSTPVMLTKKEISQ